MKALVVGAGPAGLSAALGLMRRRVDVTVIDRRVRWADRVCGGFINAEGFRHLDWLGLGPACRRGGVEVPATRLTWAAKETLRPLFFKNTVPGGVPRKTLEEILQHSVLEHGGRLLWGRSLQSWGKKGAHWWARGNGGEVWDDIDLLVWAGGRFSPFRPPPLRRKGWWGWNAEFKNGTQRPGDMAIHFFPGGYVGVLTGHEGTTHVCGLIHGETTPVSWELTFENALENSPAFRRDMAGATRCTPWNGVGPLPFSLTQTPSRGEFLVGDTAAVGDPFMGEGLGRALGAGPLLFESLVPATSPEQAWRLYNRLWKKAYAPRFFLSSGLRFLLATRGHGHKWTAPLVNLFLTKLQPSLFHRGFVSTIDQRPA